MPTIAVWYGESNFALKRKVEFFLGTAHTVDVERLYFFRIQVQNGPIAEENRHSNLGDLVNESYPDLVLSVYQGQEWVRCSRIAPSLNSAALQVVDELQAFAPNLRLIQIEEIAPSAIPCIG